jgi:hypothetical protein
LIRSRLALPGTLLVAAFLAACSSGTGPLGDVGTAGTLCVPDHVGHTLTMGFYDLHNRGADAVTIQGVTLTSAHGLTITKAWLMPIKDTTLIGTVEDYPPPSPLWAQRQPAFGATIKPGQDLNLVFGLTRTTSGLGSSSGPAITYSAGGWNYTVQEAVALQAAGVCH